jgi:hypothetical protein
MSNLEFIHHRDMITGTIDSRGEGHTVEADGIYEETELIASFPIDRISLFVDRGYLGLFSLNKDSVFYFSHTVLKYRYFASSGTLDLIFDGEQI